MVVDRGVKAQIYWLDPLRKRMWMFRRALGGSDRGWGGSERD
jgi:hypothetical protein